jgi:hypothetical protein
VVICVVFVGDWSNAPETSIVTYVCPVAAQLKSTKLPSVKISATDTEDTDGAVGIATVEELEEVAEDEELLPVTVA